MARRGSRDLAVGAMFALALIILALTVMAVGDDSRLFVKKSEYIVLFPGADGLTEGSPVKMAGVQVGTVSDIHLSADPAEVGIEVRIGVDRAFAARVREDAEAKLRILQLLSGEKYVEIFPGTPEKAELPSGSRIETQQDAEFLEQAAVAAENLNEISVSLKNVLGALERGEGLIGKMINDPDFGERGLEAAAGAFENLQRLTADLQSGKGFVGRLLQDEDFSARLDDLGQALTDLKDIMAAVDTQQGAVGALLTEGGAGQRAIEDIAEAAASLKKLTRRLESDEGLVGRLLHDEAYSEKLALDLQRIVGNTAEITEKLNRGEGTLGALINERTLYDGMEDVVAGVNDSKFARWLVRHYQKKGIKGQDSPGAQEKQEKQEKQQEKERQKGG